jgi:hypothetical protein
MPCSSEASRITCQAAISSAVVLLACVIRRVFCLLDEATKKEKGPGMEIPGPRDNQN